MPNEISLSVAGPASEDASERAHSPWFLRRSEVIAAGDLVVLVTTDMKRFLLKVTPGRELHTHHGIYRHDDMVGRNVGATMVSQLDHPALLVDPTLEDVVHHFKRGSQIIYPKDSLFLAYRLNLRSGSRVVEAGTGSGALTAVLAWHIAPAGKIYTYEARTDAFRIARQNLELHGFLPYVDMHQATIEQGFKEHDVDAAMLDVREPWLYLEQVYDALRAGGYFAALVPTANQVSDLLIGLEAGHFVDLAVEEILVRKYKPIPERLRPEDTMTAHTGYLVSARAVTATDEIERWRSRDRQRYRARLEMQARIEAHEAQQAQEDSGSDERPKRRYPKLPLPG